jgi:hypothetical protein
MPKPLYDRHWLTSKEGSGYVILNATQDEHWTYVDVELKDCSRQISLDFGYDDDESYAERLEKIELLIAKLRRLQRWMANHPPVKEEK